MNTNWLIKMHCGLFNFHNHLVLFSQYPYFYFCIFDKYNIKKPNKAWVRGGRIIISEIINCQLCLFLCLARVWIFYRGWAEWQPLSGNRCRCHYSLHSLSCGRPCIVVSHLITYVILMLWGMLPQMGPPICSYTIHSGRPTSVIQIEFDCSYLRGNQGKIV